MNGPWKQSCTAPAASTPQANANAMSAPAAPANSMAAISEAFSSTGVNAGTALAVVHVENASGECRQGNESQVWKGDANQVGRQPEPFRIAPESRARRQ